MRKIPVTMATQHPDNAFPSPFTGKRFVSTAEEIDECYKVFSELGVEEYMWDWEGKHVDEAVIDRLYQEYTNYFRKNKLGKDVFLTFRIPNIWEEKSHRLPRSFMNIIAAENAARNYKFHTPPIFEVILPMASSAKQLNYLQEKFLRIAHATEEIFETKSQLKHLDIIPLFETMDALFSIDDILEKHVSFLKKKLKISTKYLRVFIARSDPAMNMGLIPAILSCKIAINNCHKFMKTTGIKVYPWVGGGSLPFRGAINPDNVEASMDEYKGTYSFTIQSAFRCDYPMNKVKKAIKTYNKEIPKLWKKYTLIDTQEEKDLKKFIKKSSQHFKHTVEKIADTINEIAALMPRHRERVQHVGLFGYSRGLGKVTLPRAIKFTGSLYSLGVPAEFIGAGRVIEDAKKQGLDDLMMKHYVNLKRDYIHAGHYLNKENLNFLAKQNQGWKEIQNDVKIVEEFLGEDLGPNKLHHMIHRNMTSNIYYKMQLGEDFSEDLLKAAEVRKSLG